MDCATEEYAEAPFCSGPSMRECEDGSEVPETAACPTNLVGPATEQSYSCEDDGSCDDSCTPPARADCTLPQTSATDEGTVATTEEVTLDNLPATGLTDSGVMVLFGVFMVAIGVFLLKNARR